MDESPFIKTGISKTNECWQLDSVNRIFTVQSNAEIWCDFSHWTRQNYKWKVISQKCMTKLAFYSSTTKWIIWLYRQGISIPRYPADRDMWMQKLRWKQYNCELSGQEITMTSCLTTSFKTTAAEHAAGWREKHPASTERVGLIVVPLSMRSLPRPDTKRTNLCIAEKSAKTRHEEN